MALCHHKIEDVLKAYDPDTPESRKSEVWVLHMMFVMEMDHA